MNRPSSPFILALALIVGAVVAISAQTNKPEPLILPPANWDHEKHVLAPLVATNKPGDYPLHPDWIGVEKVTARSGWFTNRSEMAKQANALLDFDRFTVWRRPVFPVMPSDRFIFKFPGSPTFAYRRSLPSDAELLQMRDVSSVSNFYGCNPFSRKWTNGEAFVICFFSLRPYDSIDTLDVTFSKRANETQIDGILVRRAVLFPQQKGQ
jgi:hypothetical protein